MRDDRRPDEEAEAPEQPGLLQRVGRAVTVREIRLIDRSIGLFQNWRKRLEPAEVDDRGGRGHRAEAAEPATEEGSGAKRGRLRGFLIVAALLLAAGFGGMLFSYSLFSRTIDADDLVIDDLRDQLAQMQKADARNISIQAKDQRQIADQKRALRESAVKAEEYEEQIAQLRRQVAALTPPPPKREAAVTTAGPRLQRLPPQKTGRCKADGRDAAADVARCIEEFNRP
jgi:hypothetical protein